MWHLWQMSKKWKVRPSDLVALTDPYEAWCLDEACYMWGMHVDAELDKAGAKAKKAEVANQRRQAALTKLLGGPEESNKAYRDPAKIIGNSDKKALSKGL